MRFLLFIFLSLSQQCVIAQALSPDINVQSPNVASLGVYGKIPVSLFTGTADISIPVAELQGRALKYPLNLTYHPGGVKPNQRAGWIGEGWNLSGSAIYREVRGLPDEMNCFAVPQTGYYYRRHFVGNDWYRFAEAVGSNTVDRTWFHMTLGAGFTDLEPDIFHFNIPGAKGIFFLDHNGQWQIQSDQFVSIELDSTTPFIDPAIKNAFPDTDVISKSFNKFVITDVQGNKYTFGGSHATEYSSTIGIGNVQVGNSVVDGRGLTLKATAWHLSEVTSPNLETIYFSYERGPYTSSLYKYAYYHTTDKSVGCGTFGYANWRKGGTLISPVYLKSIDLNGQHIEFKFSKSNQLNYDMVDYNDLSDDYLYLQSLDDIILFSAYAIPYYQQNPYSNSSHYQGIMWMQLDSVIVKEGNNILKKVAFSYNNNSSERLFLEQYHEIGTNLIKTSYGFTYNEPESLPPYLSTITDHWGFYNGNTFSSFQPGNIFGQRQPSSYFLTRGMLKEIVYPTGGGTQFEFELGDYSTIVNEGNKKNLITEPGYGGIRIASIDAYAADGRIAWRKRYKYKKNAVNNGTVSSGILNDKPRYYINNASGIDMSGGTFSFSSFSSSSINDLSDNSGISIGYTEVTEISYDNVTENYTTYIFTNHDNGYMDDNPTYAYKADLLMGRPANSRSFERGRELMVMYYDNTKTKLRTTRNYWTVDYNASKSSRAVKFNFMEVGIVCNAEYYYPSFVSYLNYYYPVHLSSQVDSIFSSGSVIVNKQELEYTLHRMLRKETLHNSVDKDVSKHYRYASDYGASAGVVKTMAERNLFKQPIEQLILKDNKIVGGVLTEYTIRNNIVVPWKVYHLAIVEPVIMTSFFSSSVNTSGQLQFDPRYILQEEVINTDHRGNPIEVKSKETVATSYIWGYNGLYPVIKVTGSSIGTVKSILGNSKLNLLDLIIVTEASIDNAASLLRSHPALKDVMVESYTYVPLVGMTSKTDSRGMKEYYQYDNFKRLSTVLDHNGNIIRSYCYNYQGQDVDCFQNASPNPSVYLNILNRIDQLIIDKLGINRSIISREKYLIEDLGADELDCIELIMDLEHEFDIEINDEDAGTLFRVGDIYDFINTRQASGFPHSNPDGYQVMMNRIDQMIINQLGISPLRISKHKRIIQDLGADALDCVELVIEIEREFNIEILDEEAEKFLTVGDIYDYISERLSV